MLHSLSTCAALLRQTHSAGETEDHAPEAMKRPLDAIEAFCERLRRTNWAVYFEHPEPAIEDFSSTTGMDAAWTLAPGASAEIGPVAAAATLAGRQPHGQALLTQLNDLLRVTMNLHNVIADVFLNHQAHLSTPQQPYLKGIVHGF